MNFVRCEQCGAKALIAASQCPKCTHPLSLRDFRGEVVPLAHCHKCDTYYRRSLGGCRWCGTKANGVALPRRVIVAGVAALLAVLAVGSWQWRSARARAAASATADSLGELAGSSASAGEVAVLQAATPGGSGAAAGAVAGDSGITDSLARVDAEPAGAAPPASALSSVPGATAAPTMPTVPSPAGAPSETPAGRAGGVSPPSVEDAGRSRRAATRYAGPWVSGLAREWVNVRSSNSPGGEVVGVVTPNTRVQLGELRAGWRRVRSAGVEGWADARYFTSDSLPR